MRPARRFDLRLVAAGVFLATALGLAQPAGADAPWSPPQTVGGTCCSQQQLLALPAGGIAFAGDTGLSFAAAPGTKPVFTAPVGFTGEFSPDGVLGPLAVIVGGRTVEQMIPAGSSGIRTFGTIGTDETLTSAAGAPGTPLSASSLSLVQTFVVATTTNAALVRMCTKSCQGPAALAVIRYRAGRWSAPRAITRPSTELAGGALTTLPGNTLAVAYERNRAIYVRRLFSDNQLSAAQRVGTGKQSHVSIASAGGGRLDVAWSWQVIDEGNAATGFTARVACSSNVGHFTGRSRLLASIPVTGEGRYVGGPGLSLGQDAAGRLTLAWTAFADARFVVQASSLSTSCGTAPQTLPLPGADAVLGGLALAPSGRSTIVLEAGVYGSDPAGASTTESAHGLLASERPTHNGSFATPLQVSAADDGEVDPVVAIDQTTGRSVIAWRNVASSIQYSTAP
ncbi:MAG: hypothetical protein QOH12_1936 [Solirubrobacteraceae bacterium]|jgi:hypothetical protein|nr:hypothetical protein [Solirubrobacteraceae bacterium]